MQNPNNALRGFIAKYNAAGDPLWADRIGGRAYRIIARAEGGAFSCGFFLGTSGDFGSSSLTGLGSNDGFITKHSSDGILEWTKHAGSSSREILRSIALDGVGDTHVAGEGDPEAFEQPPFSFTGSVVVARLQTGSTSEGPSLTITQTGSELILAWPAEFTGYQLETTPALGTAFQRDAVAPTPVVGQPNTFKLPLPADDLYFRLAKP